MSRHIQNQQHLCDDLILALQTKCSIQEVPEPITPPCFLTASATTTEASSRSPKPAPPNRYGNQGHGKWFEKQIAMRIYGVDIDRYSHVNKYDIEASDNREERNVSVKTTGSNLVCLGDIRRFVQSENCDLIIGKYSQTSPTTKELDTLLSIDIQSILGHCAGGMDIQALVEYDQFVKERKKYFQTHHDPGEFAKFRALCKQRARHLSRGVLRVNTKISEPKPKPNGTFQCDNFRVQCSVSLKNLVNRNIPITDITHRLAECNVPTTIHSNTRTLKKARSKTNHTDK